MTEWISVKDGRGMIWADARPSVGRVYHQCPDYLKGEANENRS